MGEGRWRGGLLGGRGMRGGHLRGSRLREDGLRGRLLLLLIVTNVTCIYTDGVEFVDVINLRAVVSRFFFFLCRS